MPGVILANINCWTLPGKFGKIKLQKIRFPSLLCLLLLLTTISRSQKTPNIIVILADDLGWADLQCNGSTFYETPHLNQLALQGIRFTRAYATSPVCSPTRASLMTGKYPHKTGITDWITGRQANNNATSYEKMLAQPTAYQLALEEETLAEVAKKNGYKTFYSGKWHLGNDEKYWPESQGWDINKGGWNKGAPSGMKNDSTGAHFTPYNNPRLPDGPSGEYLADRLTQECIQFMEMNTKTPFLMMYSMYAVHNPLQAPKTLVKKYEAKQKALGLIDQQRFHKNEQWMKFETGWKQRTVQDNPVYAAMVENMDMNVGRILSSLERLGIDSNTIVVFTSDNGGLSTAEGSPTVNGPLRAGKGWLYEGGIRVPLLMRWNNGLLSGSTSEIPVTTADIFTTLVHAMNKQYQTNGDIDGKNIFNLLADTVKAHRRSIYWHYPHYSNQGGKPASAILRGDYKLIYHHEDQAVELFNLRDDLNEQHDLSKTNGSLTRQMNKKLHQWLKSTRAGFPVQNPDYISQLEKK